MLARRFNTLGSCLGPEVRIYMGFIIARALERTIKSLPPMSDTQLWQSFKVAANKTRLYSKVPEAISNSLNPGEIYAIKIGKFLDTSVFPQGETFGEIWESGKASSSEINFEPGEDFWQVMLQHMVLFAMRQLNNPKAESYCDFIGLKQPNPHAEIDTEKFIKQLDAAIARFEAGKNCSAPTK